MKVTVIPIIFESLRPPPKKKKKLEETVEIENLENDWHYSDQSSVEIG